MREGNHSGSLCPGACDLDSILNGFGSCGQENSFFGIISWGEGVQALRQADVGFIHGDLKTGVCVAFQLCLNSLNHFGMIMSYIEDPYSSCKVNIFIAVNITKLYALCLSDEKGVSIGYSSRYVLLTQLQ